jgi:hypothetical protein
VANTSELSPVQVAEAFLQQSAYNPVFFQKLAQLGCSPESEDEATALLQLAVRLRSYQQVAGHKSANARVEWLNRLNEGIDGALGTSSAARHVVNDVAVKLAGQEEFRDAALLLNAGLAAAAG